MSETIIHALNALGQTTRLAAFRMLVRAGPEGLSVGALADALAVPLSTLSRHLDQLQHAGLVRTWREGRHVYHAIDWTGTRHLLAYLTEDCCQGLRDVPDCKPDAGETP